MAIYLCQQAAEKIIRAVVTSEQKRAGKGHQLDEMVDLIPDDNPLKPSLRAIEALAAFATTYRYPTEVGRIKTHPTADQFAEYATRVESALDATSKAFGVNLDDAKAPAARRGPIR
jgi:HEPN domain-containing protein